MKSIIESVLVRHLGKYIDGLKNSLDIGLLDGQVSIQNVSLKPSVINQMGLPIALKFSHIEKIHIDIPWTSLKDKNTKITVKGLYALFNINYEEVEEQINASEIMKSMMERIRLQMKKKWSESGKEQTFAQKNLIRIIDNAVLNINNIHVRIQSFRRNWDYSIGVIMDDMSCFTVDEQEQKTFYKRSFSKKQTNLPFNKILNIPTFEIYHNDEEKVFMSNSLHNGRGFMLKMMAYPFAWKEQHNNKKQKGLKKKHLDEAKPVPHYELNKLGMIGLTAMGTQTFAEDMRYNVSLNIHITKIGFSIGDKQISQLIHTFQHLYEYALNVNKNGGKAFSFEEEAQKSYKEVIQKIAKEEKLTNNEQKFILGVIQNVPTSMLENINDEVINQVRFSKAVKKITKVSNTQKSKKMMDQLLKKKEQWEGMEGVDLFKEVKIYSKIDKVMLNLLNKGQKFAQIGILGIEIDCLMQLSGFVKVDCRFLNSILRYNNTEYTKDLYDYNLPWVHMYFEITKEELTKMEVEVNKKEIICTQPMLDQLIDWISLIRVSPTLENYVVQMMDYSIDITRVSIKFLCQKDRNIRVSVGWPILTLQLDQNTKLTLSLGTFLGKNSQNYDQFHFQYSQGINLFFNSKKMFEIGEGTVMSFVDSVKKQVPYEKVVVQVPNFFIENVDQIIQFLYALQKSNTYQIFYKYNALQLVDRDEDGYLEGQFYLNKVKSKLKMKLWKTKLVFDPIDEKQSENFPEQSISLTRTRIFKLMNNKRYFIVFKEEVDKLVNIVEASSQKIMDTIFQKLNDRIKSISTSFQWDKYYKKPYNYEIASLQQIQDKDRQNDILMMLDFSFNKISLQFSQNGFLNLQKIGTIVTYHQFNTTAEVQLSKVDLLVDEEKIIYDASFRCKYKYIQSMQIQLEVLKLGYMIQKHQTISRLIAIASQYQLLVFSMKAKNPKKKMVVEEDQERLKGIKTQSNRPDHFNNFLQQRKFTIQTTDISGEILGYSNKLSFLRLEVEKYRNEPEHRILTELKGIVLLSMIELPLINLKKTGEQFELLVDSLNASIDLDILIFQVIKGEGSLILKELIKAYRDKEIAKIQNKKDQEKQNEQYNAQNYSFFGKNFIFKLDFLRIQLNITSNLCIGFLSRDIQMELGRLSWTGLIFQLNNQNISTTYNNGILKWSQENVDFCMTNCQLKLNSKQVIYLLLEVKKIVTYLINQNLDIVRFISEEMKNPDQQGRVLEKKKKQVNIRIEQLQVIYECADKHPLISLRLKPIFLTNEGQINTVNLSIWHLNRNMKLYEPVIQPFQLKIIEKRQSSQLDFYFDNLYVIVSQQFIMDVIEQLKLLKEIGKRIDEDEKNEIEQLNKDQVEYIKKSLVNSHFKQYAPLDFEQMEEYNFTLIITNHLSSKTLIEVNCGKKQKEQILFQNEEKGVQTKTVKIPQKTSYSFSYQLIQRYQKVNIKICMLNSFYSTSTVTVEFHLYDRYNHYITPVTVMDGNGIEKNTNLAVKVQYVEGNYNIDIMGMYSVSNQTQIPLFCQYQDEFGLSKFRLGKTQRQSLPLWVINQVDLGIKQDHFCHILKLKNNQEEEEEEESYELKIKTTQNTTAVFIVEKEEFFNQKRYIPELNTFKLKEEVQQPKEQPEFKPRLFNFRLRSGFIIKNHLQFPIKVNGKVCENEEPAQILQVFQQQQKNYVKLELGDGTVHNIEIPPQNQKTSSTLKLQGQNFVTIYTLARTNKNNQKILHFYSELKLLLNIPHIFTPQIRTNIYQYFYILQRQVKNGYSDKIHPSPILKDKFVFHSYHYLINLEQRYLVANMNGCKSNQIILYHSDFDKDMKFRRKEEDQPEYVYAVSYSTKHIELQNQDQDDDVVQTLECHYTYIMPKYYLINKTGEGIVMDGNLIIHSGQKIALDNIQQLSLNIRDRLQFHYVPTSFKQTNHLIFVKEENDTEEKEQLKQVKKKKYAHLHIKKQESKQQSDSTIPKSMENLTQHPQKQDEDNSPIKKFESAPILEAIPQPITEEEVQTEVVQIAEMKEEREEKREEEEKELQNISNCIKMPNIVILSLSKRVGDYGTISYEINQWHEWLVIKNKLSCPIVLRVKLSEDTLGMETIGSDQTGRIISGLSQRMQIVLCMNNQELVLGTYDLTKRLNHTIFLNDFEDEQIILKQFKAKIGRQMVIESNRFKKDKAIYKVLSSINIDIGKVIISFVLHQQKVRKQLVRFNIVHPKIMFLYYKNGLYMCHLKLDAMHGIFKRMLFLIVKDFQGYLQGYIDQFLERTSLSIGETIHITVTDDMIVSFMEQFQIFQKYFPKSELLEREEVILQEEQTYHINSLGIKGLQIKLCLRKIISEKDSHQSKVLEHYGLSMVEVEDAVITLSQIDINVPLKTKHINNISQMYAMEAFVGIASGLNILGNPAQFKSEFEAARNRGGVFPFCRAIVAGISNSISKIIGTIGSGFSELTFDKQFMRSRYKDKKQKADSFATGLKMGFMEFGYSLGSGITGIVEQPTIGFQEEGGVGILKGTIFGLTGLVTKPVTGLILAISKTIEGFNSSVTNMSQQNLLGKDLIVRPLYHKFKMVRPYRSQDEFAYNILINWYEYDEVELVGSYLLQNQEDDSIIQLLIITCSQLILIDLKNKDILLKLKIEKLLATGKFLEGVVLYFQDGSGQNSQDELVFRMTRDAQSRQNLYWTLKSFIGLYVQV